MRSTSVFDTLLADIRYAARKLLRAPGFTIAVVLTLAVAIGANTAIFSVVYGVLLRPLAFRDAGRVVEIPEITEKGTQFPVSGPDLNDLSGDSHSFAAVAGMASSNVNLTGVGDAERLVVVRAGAPFFDVMGVPPALGRGFTPSEDVAGAPHVVVLSDALWRRRF